MIKEYIKTRRSDLELQRQVALDEKQHFLKLAEDKQQEIDYIDVRIHELELISMNNIDVEKEDNSIEAHVEDAIEIIKTDDSSIQSANKIQVVESEKEINGIGTAIETANTTGEKINQVLHLMKKNEYGMPMGHSRLIIHMDHLIELKNIIKERKVVHYDDFEGINRKKFTILASYFDDSVSNEFKNIKYDTMEGTLTKYLQWVECFYCGKLICNKEIDNHRCDKK